MENINLLELLQLDYCIALIVLTEVVKYLFTGITKAIHPKFITLFLAIVLAAIFIAIRGMDEFNLYKYLISFGVAVLTYDYAIKIFKDKIRAFINKNRPTT